MERELRISYSSLLLFTIPALLLAGLLYRTVLWHSSEDPITKLKPVEQPLQLFSKGNLLFKENKYREAEQCFRQVIKLQPHHYSAQYNLGLTLERQHKWHESADCFKLLVEKQPDSIELRLHYAQALEHNLQREQAINQYLYILSKDPSHLNAHIKLGILYTQQHTSASYNQAKIHLEQANQLSPATTLIQLALADLLLWQGNNKHAFELFDILEKNHASAELLTMIAHQLENHLEFKHAQEYYQKALALDFNYPRAHIGLAGNCFALGKYEQGFEEYEWRWHLSNVKNLPGKWDGSNPAGKTIVLIGENGLGDIIQFIRFAKTVKEQGATVLLRVPEKLASLLSLCPFIDQVIHSGQTTTPAYDAITSVQSVPFLTKLSKEQFPKPPYLYADPTLVSQWQQKVAHDHNFKIGLCWAAGGDMHEPHKRRSVPLSLLAELRDINGISFYCLQKGKALDELNQLPSDLHIIDFGKDFDEKGGAFMDSAALIKNLDLVVTIDTSVAHLAGALGAPTLLFLPYACDPRWMIGSSKTHWYPSITLFRQQKPGDWATVVKQVKKHITELVHIQ